MAAEITPQDQERARRFPIQGGPCVPWSVAEVAYATYYAHHKSQTLERLAERGGFGIQEFACLHQGHMPGARAPHMSGNQHGRPMNEADGHAQCVAAAFATAALAGQRERIEARADEAVRGLRRLGLHGDGIKVAAAKGGEVVAAAIRRSDA